MNETCEIVCFCKFNFCAHVVLSRSRSHHKFNAVACLSVRLCLCAPLLFTVDPERNDYTLCALHVVRCERAAISFIASSLLFVHRMHATNPTISLRTRTCFLYFILLSRFFFFIRIILPLLCRGVPYVYLARSLHTIETTISTFFVAHRSLHRHPNSQTKIIFSFSLLARE